MVERVDSSVIVMYQRAENMKSVSRQEKVIQIRVFLVPSRCCDLLSCTHSNEYRSVMINAVGA